MLAIAAIEKIKNVLRYYNPPTPLRAPLYHSLINMKNVNVPAVTVSARNGRKLSISRILAQPDIHLSDLSDLSDFSDFSDLSDLSDLSELSDLTD